MDAGDVRIRDALSRALGSCVVLVIEASCKG
jgi:hypothetical protein